MNTNVQDKQQPVKVHDCTNGQKPTSKVNYGDYMLFDDGRYQVRGNGNHKQIYQVYR